MKTTSYLNINKTPKAFKIFLILIPVAAIAVMLGAQVDNDFYFLYPTGEYILNNGFPTKDFLTWHSNMDIIVQQWLSSVIFYLIASKLKMVGLIAFEFICSMAVFALLFRLCYLLSKNFFVSYCASSVSAVMIATSYITTRPQVFTYIILICELIALEKFVSSNRFAYLLVLPLLSLALVNLHSSMWLMFFAFILPYYFQAITLKIGKLNVKASYSFFKLLAATVLSFGAGFINPYGIKSMLYLFNSYGYETINSYIQEMMPISISNPFGKLLFGILVLLLILMFLFKKGKCELRILLLFLGTLYLGLSSVKGFVYFEIALCVFVASYFKDFTFNLKITDDDEKKSFDFKKVGLVFLAAVIICGSVLFYVSSTDNSDTDEAAEEASEREQLDEIIAYLKSENPDEMVVYNGFNCGPYLEYNGIKTFMDARAELFFEKNNHEFDYYNEMLDAENGKIYYKEYFDKYGFTHLVILKSTAVMYNSLIRDEDYQEVISGEDYSLFVKTN